VKGRIVNPGFACFFVLNVRAVDSMRLISVVWFRSRLKTIPREYHRYSVLELQLHKSDSLYNGSWPANLGLSLNNPNIIAIPPGRIIPPIGPPGMDVGGLPGSALGTFSGSRSWE
jgi:hypothetical protein